MTKLIMKGNWECLCYINTTLTAYVTYTVDVYDGKNVLTVLINEFVFLQNVDFKSSPQNGQFSSLALQSQVHFD